MSFGNQIYHSSHKQKTLLLTHASVKTTEQHYTPTAYD